MHSSSCLLRSYFARELDTDGSVVFSVLDGSEGTGYDVSGRSGTALGSQGLEPMVSQHAAFFG